MKAKCQQAAAQADRQTEEYGHQAKDKLIVADPLAGFSTLGVANPGANHAILAAEAVALVQR
jgi:hypothetical protein